ncbi:unnamed protein product, partial [Ectocarpus sp. 12 AP-2014]
AALSEGNFAEAPQPENTAATRENVCSKIGLIGVAFTVPPAHELPYPLQRRAKQKPSLQHAAGTAVIPRESPADRGRAVGVLQLNAPSSSPSLRPPHHHRQQSSRRSSDGRSYSSSSLGVRNNAPGVRDREGPVEAAACDRFQLDVICWFGNRDWGFRWGSQGDSWDR